MTSSCHHSKFSTTFVLQTRIAPKLRTRKIGFSVEIGIKRLELDYKEHDYVHIEGHKGGHGTSRSLKVVANPHRMLFDIVKLINEKFMSLGLVYFHIHSLLLIHDENNKTEHF